MTVPEAAAPEPPRQSARLYPPESPEPPRAPPTGPVEPTKPERARPEVTEQSSAPSEFPVGIPQFATVQDGLTTGLKPSLEGLDWLQAHGYRTALHIKQPGEDDTADRRVVESHKMKYLSVNVSPKTLSRAVVDDFNRIVGDRANAPLFVYDANGVLAGGLWYLHFRTADQDTDEVARLKAARLGLKEEQDDANRAMWLAIQQFLSEQKR